MVALQLLAVWSVPFVPTQDGPAHLEIAAVLDGLLREPEGALSSYYALNRSPEPNLLADLLLAGLLRVAGCEAGEKLLLSLFLVLLPVAFVYCVRAVRRDSAYLGVLVLPLGMSFFFHMGFHNFCLAVPLSLFTLGFWLRHRESPSRGALAVFGLLLLTTALAHALPATASYRSTISNLLRILLLGGAYRVSYSPARRAQPERQGLVRRGGLRCRRRQPLPAGPRAL
ncbi:MAG TPA: hypothetical protein VF150_06230, partial [Thermoanaerobaculia bacterium]